ncbi:NAD-dependent epimerase/dehydratase [Calothrix sp. NIES-4071]|nr:NAD-dependent epimerase/dehydratase [Calothrix sp. NIES-4071]BAZ57050.1 NAD-dependent epimerase/dehydratase [Calothrix sp. NIES-4105]
MTRILISGGAGFIGRHVTQLLISKSHEVVWLDNLDTQIHGEYEDIHNIRLHEQVKLIVGSVCEKEAWRQAIDGVDAIVHFAAQTGTGQSMYQIARYTDENIGGTGVMWDVLANETHQVKKVLIASSRAIYGEGAYRCISKCGNVVPLPRSKAQLVRHQWSPVCPKCGADVEPIATPEDSTPQPASLYAITKLAQEQMSLTMGKALGISTIALRFQNVFGSGQSLRNPYTGIISIFSNQMRQNLPINIYEDGEETRDFILVNDVAKICELALSSDYEALVLNVGSGLATKVIDLAYNLKYLWNSDSSIEITGDSRVGDIRHNWADLRVLHKVFPDWQPTPLEVGLEKFVAWAATQEIYEDKSKIAAQELKQRNL